MSLFVEPYRIIPVIGDYAVARARMPPPGHICYGCGNYNPFQPCVGLDRKSTRLNSSHVRKSRMPSSA